MANVQDIQSKLDALSSEYAASLSSKLNNIDALWQRVRVNNKTKDISELLFLCHKLAGSCASFGFKDLSANARTLEIELNTYLEEHTDNKNVIWDETTRLKFAKLLDKLLTETQCQETITNCINTEFTKETSLEADNKILIYIQEKNRMVVDELMSKLVSYNYNVRNFSSLKDLNQAILDTPPDVVIIDNTLFNTSTKKTLVDLKKTYHFKIIHLANSGDFNERLEAVRIGVDNYFTKPVDFSAVIDSLDKLSTNPSTAPSKVLIADDSISTSQFYALALKSVDIETKVVNDPFKVMEEVIDFKPELILLDLNMPKCNGLELAAVIRQQENYISIPIVFLSGETDSQKQLETLEIGADEFLEKPINANHLISIVKNKIIRYRQLSSYMHNDSLTGILNHTSILTALDTEIARAKREQSNLSYAMIDIDFFKKVNDSYGHHTGDLVLKNISRFIRQNLRITDYVGRYGGEEFVAIFPGIDAAKAVAVMQKILDNFSLIEFTHLNHKFKVTFSCGVSDYITFQTAGKIIDAADKALYEAKASGRHCIKLATPD